MIHLSYILCDELKMVPERLRRRPGWCCRAGAIVDPQGGSNGMIQPCVLGRISCAALQAHQQPRVADELDRPGGCWINHQFTGRRLHESAGHMRHCMHGPRLMRQISEPFRVPFHSCGSVRRHFASRLRPLSGSALRPPSGFRCAGLPLFLTASHRALSTRPRCHGLSGIGGRRPRPATGFIRVFEQPSSNHYGGNP